VFVDHSHYLATTGPLGRSFAVRVLGIKHPEAFDLRLT
jgi:hypothetical protein